MRSTNASFCVTAIGRCSGVSMVWSTETRALGLMGNQSKTASHGDYGSLEKQLCRRGSASGRDSPGSRSGASSTRRVCQPERLHD